MLCLAAGARCSATAPDYPNSPSTRVLKQGGLCIGSPREAISTDVVFLFEHRGTPPPCCVDETRQRGRGGSSLHGGGWEERWGGLISLKFIEITPNQQTGI